MISKQMHKLLIEIPHSPTPITFKELSDKNLMNINLLSDLVKEAKASKYIAFNAYNPYNDLHTSKFCLTEEGQVAIEEFEGTKYNTTLSIWAIVISGLSFLASVAAVVVACIVK